LRDRLQGLPAIQFQQARRTLERFNFQRAFGKQRLQPGALFIGQRNVFFFMLADGLWRAVKRKEI